MMFYVNSEMGGYDMNKVIESLLAGKNENYLLPFLWLHGEDESVLRDYMRAIYEIGRASCRERV